jgi:hypothetical protein
MTTEQKPADDKPLDAETKMVIDNLMLALQHNVPGLGDEARMQTVFDFLDFLGKLVACLEGAQPTPGRAAALLVMVQRLSLDQSGLGEMKIMVTLQEALAVIEKRKKGPPS